MSPLIVILPRRWARARRRRMLGRGLSLGAKLALAGVLTTGLLGIICWLALTGHPRAALLASLCLLPMAIAAVAQARGAGCGCGASADSEHPAS